MYEIECLTVEKKNFVSNSCDPGVCSPTVCSPDIFGCSPDDCSPDEYCKPDGPLF